MPPLTSDVWQRRGHSLLWNAQTLFALAPPQDTVTLRQFFALVAQWPDDLPANEGRTLIVVGLEGALDSLSPDDAAEWLENDLQETLRVSKRLRRSSADFLASQRPAAAQSQPRPARRLSLDLRRPPLRHPAGSRATAMGWSRHRHPTHPRSGATQRRPRRPSVDGVVSGQVVVKREDDTVLQSMMIRNLTVFPEADLQFSPQINVIVGENGTGKSHLLKVAYAVLAASAEEGRKPNAPLPTKTLLQVRLAEKLIAVLRPETLGRLARRKQGRERCELCLDFMDARLNLAFSFATMSKSEVGIEQLPAVWVEKAPVFLPTRELLTLYPGFVSVYENHYLEFEETWRDTCLLLGAPTLRGPKEKRVKEWLAPLEQAMGGAIELDRNGRFYLNSPGQGRMEMPLVAEGLRKLAMLARLIATPSYWNQHGCGV